MNEGTEKFPLFFVNCMAAIVDGEVREVCAPVNYDLPDIEESLKCFMLYIPYETDKDEITTEAIVSHFGFTPTTAKRYLRQLTELGYLEAHGGNKNRTYSTPSASTP